MDDVYAEMSRLSAEEMVEYALIERDGKVEMVKGHEQRVSMLEPPSRIIAHTHPHGPAWPSEPDIKTMTDIGQSSSLIIDVPNSRTVEFHVGEYLLRPEAK